MSKSRVPFAALSIEDDDVEAVVQVLRSGWITTGEECFRFEAELSEYLGGVDVVALASCTHALEISLRYLGLPPGARVGVPTWTFASTALSAHHAGLRPVLLDVDADSLNLCPHSLAAAHDDEPLSAVIPVHFGGSCVSDEIFDIASKVGLPVIEDAAHALGAQHGDGKKVNGDRSVAACFSFYATKNLTSGEGGAIATRDATLADFARSHRLHGLDHDAWRRNLPDGHAVYDLVGPGLKANFPDILAALARSQLRKFPEMQNHRLEQIQLYRRLLEDGTGVRFVPSQFDVNSAHHLAVVVLPEGCQRTDVMNQMRDAGVQTSLHFRPLHHFRWARENLRVGVAGTSGADSVADRVLSLPLYPGLSEEALRRVVDALVDAVNTWGG